MTDEKWMDLLETIKDKFKIESEEFEPVVVEQNDGEETEIGKIHHVIFTSPMGKIKLSRKTTPLVEGRQEQYHKRSGVAMTKFIYSETEKVHSLEAFMRNTRTDRWEKIDTKGTFTI